MIRNLLCRDLTVLFSLGDDLGHYVEFVTITNDLISMFIHAFETLEYYRRLYFTSIDRLNDVEVLTREFFTLFIEVVSKYHLEFGDVVNVDEWKFILCSWQVIERRHLYKIII